MGRWIDGALVDGDAEARWAAVLKRVARAPERRPIDSRGWRLLCGAAAATTALAVAAGVWGLLRPADQDSAGIAAVLSGLGVAFFCAAVAAMVAGWSWASRRGTMSPNMAWVLRPLTRAERRLVRRQIRGRRPVPRDSVPALRAIAAPVRHQLLGTVVPVLGLALLQAGQLLVQSKSSVQFLFAAAALLMLGGAASTVWDARRIQRFLGRVAPDAPDKPGRAEAPGHG
ncbi:hypothetical protein ACQCSX_15005 [Pseudarthrobacter sp. P1]|uniref:hypothetical protein n=1 Tax=Pseudarthrobacter sp. P1 TaxID=3418418 RepID=UPI003CF6A474